MLTAEHRQAFEDSLRSTRPTVELSDVVRRLLKDSEDSRQSLLEELEEFRTVLRADHRDSDDDVVLEVMDFLVGWASPNAKLVPLKHGRSKRRNP